MIIVSACLVGINCKYNGGNNADPDVRRLVEEGKAIPVCPEQLGGLTTPRLPAEISGGTGADVLDGMRVTERRNRCNRELFKWRARNAQNRQAYRRIMKSGSPSCGYGKICNGTFGKKEGNGVTADLLRNGIKICTENGMKNPEYRLVRFCFAVLLCKYLQMP